MAPRSAARLGILPALLSLLALLPAVALAAPAQASGGPSYSWRPLTTGSAERFRGLAAVSGQVAWLAGTNGTVLRTTDGGDTWRNVSPPRRLVRGSDGLVQFRDIQAWDARHAVALAIGTGTDSRVLTTDNGGRTWRIAFTNQSQQAFYDCMAFFDRWHGLAVSDPVNGKFRLISTSDGGASWHVLSNAGMPAALPGEFGFAASGTCLVTSGAHDAWIASGGGATSRVYHSGDRGRTWSVTSTPIASSASAGIFSLAVKGGERVVAVGGDFLAPDAAVKSAAWSGDAGQSWRLARDLPGGYRSGAAWVSHAHSTVLAVGPTGSDVSRDGGRTWTAFDTASYDSVECVSGGACWASGDAGAAARLVAASRASAAGDA